MKEGPSLPQEPTRTKSRFLEKTVEVNGRKINFLSLGNFSHHAVVLFHGAGANAELCWRNSMGPLSDYGLPVIAPDLPGYGKSDDPEHFTTQEYVQEMCDFIDSLRLESFDTVGLSKGGAIAIGTGLRKRERVRKQVLVDTYGLGEKLYIPIGDESPIFRAFTKYFRETAIHLIFSTPFVTQAFLWAMREIGTHDKRSIRFLVERILAQKGFVTDELVEDAISSGVIKKGAKTFSKWLHEELHTGKPQTNFLPDLSKNPLIQPTLILQSGKDRVIWPQWGEKLRELLPNAKLSRFENSGHGLPVAFPEPFVSEVGPFLAAA